MNKKINTYNYTEVFKSTKSQPHITTVYIQPTSLLELIIMHSNEKYETDCSPESLKILEQAASIIEAKFKRGEQFSSAEDSKKFLTYKLAGYEREVFAALLLDNQNRLIEYKELFYGTINSTTVHPREIIKVILDANAAAVIFAHNHPSGESAPSMQDHDLTKRLVDLLKQIDVPVLDHIVVGEVAYSFMEHGYI